MQVAVVGAGLSGLAAALRLQQAGHDVTVYEATQRAGGRCSAIMKQGFLIDCCPEIAASSYERFLNLARTVGLADDILPCSPVVSVLHHGRMVDIDMSRWTSLVFTPILSWRAKFALLWGYWRNQRQLADCNAYTLADRADLDDPSTNAENYAVEMFGAEAADRLIDPLMRLVGGASMAQVSKLCVLGGVKSWAAAMVTIRGGYFRVADAAAQRLRIRFGATVAETRATDRGVTIRYRDAAGHMQDAGADYCVLTTLYDDSVRIFPRLRDLGGASVPFARLIDIKLAYGAATHSLAFVGQIPSSEDRELLLLSLTHNKAPDRAPPGHSLFTLYTDAMVWDKFDAMTDEAVIDWGRGHVEKLYPEVKGRFLFGHVHRQARAGYLAEPGFYRRIARLFADLAGSRIQLAGDLFAGGSMEAAVVWGERAADRVIEFAKQGKPSGATSIQTPQEMTV